MKKSDEVIIRKINGYCSNILEFTKNYNYSDFSADEKTCYSTSFALLQIGELAHKLSPEFKGEYDYVNWRSIIGLRHRIVHDYDGVQISRVWDIVNENIPVLFKYACDILEDC